MFLLLAVAGIHIGWASPNFARFSMNSSEISVKPNEVTWLASFDAFGMTLGSVVGPTIIEFYGPKQTGFILFVFYSINWVCLMLANHYVWLLVARFIGGLTATASSICTSMYLGEISQPKIRGTQISVATTGLVSGILIGTFLETYLSSKISCLIYLVHCFIGIALLIFMLPESPYFLMKARDISKTRKSIMVYFPNLELEEKFAEIKNCVKEQTSLSVKDRFKILKTAPVNKSLILTLILSSLIQSSGIMNIRRFFEIILRRGKSLMIDPQKLVIYINILNILLRFITFTVSDKFGRKFLLIAASTLVSLSLLCLGIYFHLLNLNFELDGFEWIPIICVLLFMVSFSIGFFTGFSTVLSEIFPLNVKSIATCVACLTGSFFDFVLSTLFLPISNSIGEEYIFWIHAAAAFLVIPLVFFFLPETKGKTLEEIQNNLLKK